MSGGDRSAPTEQTRLRRWEARRQVRLNAAAARQTFPSKVQRPVVTSPAGRAYEVRVVRAGATLRSWMPSTYADSGLVGLGLVVAASPLAAAAGVTSAVRVRRASGWTVGIISANPVRGVVSREHADDDDAARDVVERLVGEVEAGRYDR